MRGLWAAVAVAVAVVACQQGPAGGDTAAGLVTESDSMSCGTTSTIFTNHTANAKDLHVRSTWRCTMVDTIRPPYGRLVVFDAQGRVSQGQDVQLPYGETHRGSFTIPGGGGRLVLECRGDRILEGNGCQWSYSYSP